MKDLSKRTGATSRMRWLVGLLLISHMVGQTAVADDAFDYPWSFLKDEAFILQWTELFKPSVIQDGEVLSLSVYLKNRSTGFWVLFEVQEFSLASVQDVAAFDHQPRRAVLFSGLDLEKALLDDREYFLRRAVGDAKLSEPEMVFILEKVAVVEGAEVERPRHDEPVKRSDANILGMFEIPIEDIPVTRIHNIKGPQHFGYLPLYDSYGRDVALLRLGRRPTPKNEARLIDPMWGVFYGVDLSFRVKFHLPEAGSWQSSEANPKVRVKLDIQSIIKERATAKEASIGGGSKAEPRERLIKTGRKFLDVPLPPDYDGEFITVSVPGTKLLSILYGVQSYVASFLQTTPVTSETAVIEDSSATLDLLFMLDIDAELESGRTAQQMIGYQRINLRDLEPGSEPAKIFLYEGANDDHTPDAEPPADKDYVVIEHHLDRLGAEATQED